MSDEQENLIEETFITKLGAKYPWVKAKGCNDKYGVSGFPTVVVIGPDGLVKHNDNGMPSEQMLEELLKGVTLAPKVPDGPQFAALRTAWQKADYAKLRDHIDKTLAQPNLDAAVQEVYEAQKGALEQRAESQTARVQSLGAGPDYAASAQQLEKIEKAWKGFPAAAAAKAELARFGADAKIKKELAAGKALQKLLDGFDTSRASEVKKLVVELPKFAKKYEGTHAAQQATEQAAEWEKKLKGNG